MSYGGSDFPAVIDSVQTSKMHNKGIMWVRWLVPGVIMELAFILELSQEDKLILDRIVAGV